MIKLKLLPDAVLFGITTVGVKVVLCAPFDDGVQLNGGEGLRVTSLWR